MHPREELISAMADGMLDVAQTHKVARHLRDCADCRAILADFERNKASFRALQAPAPLPQQFWDDTFRKMRTADAAVAGGAAKRGLLALPRQVRTVIAAAACLVVALVVPLSTHFYSVVPPTVSSGVSATTAEDSLDAADVSSFIRAHTESVASQPLSDPDRQQMIAADAAMPADEQTPEPAGNADVSL